MKLEGLDVLPWRILIILSELIEVFHLGFLFSIICQKEQANKKFFIKTRNHFRHDVRLCVGEMNKEMKLQSPHSGLCAAPAQTTLSLGGAGGEAGSGPVSVTSQTLPHFQVSALREFLFPSQCLKRLTPPCIHLSALPFLPKPSILVLDPTHWL